jgi:RNA polymerase sigma-70 factor (ECF subfamily)
MMATVDHTITSKTMATAGDTEHTREAAWVEASRCGDSRAFNHLVLRWERPIFGLAWRMLRSRAEAEEATQEIFLSAYKAMHRFRQGARFSTWLYRIATNHCISRLRRRPAMVQVPLAEQVDEDEAVKPVQLQVTPTHEADLITADTRREVLAALAELGDEQRLVVELKFYQELTFDGIAEILDIPTSTVKSRFYTALGQLKSSLTEN